MIISHHHRYVFVAVPRTGTHSLRHALRRHLGSDDWEQCILFEKKTLPIQPLARIGHGHVSCTQLRAHFHPQLWDHYFKFCFVRNPYDRFVSACCFANRENDRMSDDPLGTMKRTLDSEKTRQHFLFRPQYELVTDSNGQLLVDYVGRFEDYQTHFESIAQQIGLPKQQLEIANASPRQSDEMCCDDELKQGLRQVYERDFKLFGY